MKNGPFLSSASVSFHLFIRGPTDGKMSASKKRRAKKASLSTPSLTSASSAKAGAAGTKPFIGCKHVPNAQVSIRAECCGHWYDCPLCHDEKEGHTFTLKNEVVFACKVCKQAFRKDMQQFEEHDECCPHCGNCFVVAHSKEAEVVTKAEEAKASASAAAIAAAGSGSAFASARSYPSARSTSRSTARSSARGGTARSSKSQRK